MLGTFFGYYVLGLMCESHENTIFIQIWVLSLLYPYGPLTSWNRQGLTDGLMDRKCKMGANSQRDTHCGCGMLPQQIK